MKLLRPLALSALALVGLAGTASAQFPQQPIRTFPPSHSHSHRPPVVIEQPVVVAPPVVVQRPPIVVGRPVLVPVQPQQPVYCLDTFARDFRPCPGRHHILIEHPVTKCPVEVCFTLPDCKLRDFDVRRRSIEFDYGRHEVKIEFKRDGTVCVHGG